MVHFLWCLRLDLRRVGKPIDVLRGGVGLPAVEDVGALPLVVLVVQALGRRGALAAGIERRSMVFGMGFNIGIYVRNEIKTFVGG